MESEPAEGQLSFDLPAPPVDGDAPLVPARMVNEFVYCPRLAYLMWTQSEWADSADTVDGTPRPRARRHGRADPCRRPETRRGRTSPRSSPAR